MITRPMKACKAPAFEDIRFPVLVSGKLDGIRCIHPSKKIGPVSKNFKMLANVFITKTLRRIAPVGVDGEIIIPDAKFNDTQSSVLTGDGKPEFEYHIFDYVDKDLNEPFGGRMRKLLQKNLDPRIVVIEQVLVNNLKELKKAKDKFYRAGFEGIIIRDPNGRYKCGTATVNEGTIFKHKRMVKGVGTIVGFHELMHNLNEPELGNFGNTIRSHHKAGKVGGKMLGSFEVTFMKTTFKLGSGFDMAQRKKYWRMRKRLKGVKVKYTYQAFGTKDKPRFPIFEELLCT